MITRIRKPQCLARHQLPDPPEAKDSPASSHTTRTPRPPASPRHCAWRQVARECVHCYRGSAAVITFHLRRVGHDDRASSPRGHRRCQRRPRPRPLRRVACRLRIELGRRTDASADGTSRPRARHRLSPAALGHPNRRSSPRRARAACRSLSASSHRKRPPGRVDASLSARTPPAGRRRNRDPHTEPPIRLDVDDPVCAERRRERRGINRVVEVDRCYDAASAWPDRPRWVACGCRSAQLYRRLEDSVVLATIASRPPRTASTRVGSASRNSVATAGV